MAEIFKFFNSAPGDERWHYASDFADYFGSVLSSGLISNGNSPVGLQVTVNTGTMTTSVNVGRALIKGYSYENTTPLTLTHSTPEQTLDRIDRIVLRLDLKNASRFIKVFVKEGVSALEPVPPTLQRDQYIYELSLAQVRIRKNTSSIVVSDIKDERADENLCGIVQSLITVPTSVFQQQFDTWFNSQKDIYESNIIEWQNQEKVDFESWINSMHDILDENTAGNLLSIINDHKADLVSHGVYGIVTGTNTLTMTIGNVNAYVEGMLVAFKNTTANTGATTLNINNLGAKSIKKANGSALSSGNLKAGGVYQVRYDGSSFFLLGEGGEYGTANASDVRKTKTFGTENGVKAGTLDLSNLTSSNIKKGITIDGISGTLVPLGVGNMPIYTSTKVSGNRSKKYAEVFAFRVSENSTYRVSFDLSTDSGYGAYARIYKNGAPYGMERTSNSFTPTTYTEDITVNSSDRLSIYSYNNSEYGLTTVKNVKIMITDITVTELIY